MIFLIKISDHKFKGKNRKLAIGNIDFSKTAKAIPTAFSLSSFQNLIFSKTQDRNLFFTKQMEYDVSWILQKLAILSQLR